MEIQVNAKYNDCDLKITVFFDEPDLSVGWNGNMSVEEILYDDVDVTQLLSSDDRGVYNAAYDALKKWAKETGKKYWNIL